MPRFTMPRDIHYSRESIGLLSTIRGKRAMLVTMGGEMKQRGILSRAETALRRTGMEVRLLEANNLEHVEQAVAEGASAMRAFAPDWIVALGGMAIDTAKLMWILYEYPEAVLSDLHLPFSLPDLRRKARFAAIPSLGGGAPEATAFAEIGGTAEQCAWAAVDYGIVPDVTFIDPELGAAASSSEVAEAGMEAFAYALDAYTACEDAPFAEPPAQKAAELALQHLVAAQAGDGFAREQILYAQTLAGIAFSNVCAGLTHAFARQLAALFAACRTHSGALCAIFLPHVIRFNAADTRTCARYARLARALGLRGRADVQAAQALAEEIETLRVAAKLPGTLQELGVGEADFERCRRTAAARVAADFCAAANPRTVPEAAAEALLSAAFNGSE